MFDEEKSSIGSALRYAGISLMLLYVVGSAFLMYSMRARISDLQETQREMLTKQQAIGRRLENAAEDLKATATRLRSGKLGLTQKDLAARTAELQQQQKAAVEQLQQEQERRLGAVAGEVAGVRSAVGRVETDVVSAKKELEVTKARLERTVGDLGILSGLIARTRADLDLLRQRGERNYYEFTLHKGGKPVPISTISMQLKKTDRKKGRFTLKVLADDREIEKRDRNLNEPLQFYTGRERRLYEVVVFSVEKNTISGYLSTPKT
jgi:hypothetical protein